MLKNDSVWGMTESKPPMWTLSKAQLLVVALQPKLHDMGWHVALGGGVLTKGESRHDLDLYVLPMNVEGREDAQDVLGELHSLLDAQGASDMFKGSTDGNGDDYDPPNHAAYQQARKFLTGAGVVDVFVVQS